MSTTHQEAMRVTRERIYRLLQVKAGRITEARTTIGKIKGTTAHVSHVIDKSLIYLAVTKTQAKAGDMAEAKEMTALIGESHDQAKTR